MGGRCDLLLVMGTSLVVQPFASLVDRVPPDCPRLLINREKAPPPSPHRSPAGFAHLECTPIIPADSALLRRSSALAYTCPTPNLSPVGRPSPPGWAAFGHDGQAGRPALRRAGQLPRRALPRRLRRRRAPARGPAGSVRAKRREHPFYVCKLLCGKNDTILPFERKRKNASSSPPRCPACVSFGA